MTTARTVAAAAKILSMAPSCMIPNRLHADRSGGYCRFLVLSLSCNTTVSGELPPKRVALGDRVRARTGQRRLGLTWTKVKSFSTTRCQIYGVQLRPVHTTPEKYWENTALFLRLGPPSTLIRRNCHKQLLIHIVRKSALRFTKYPSLLLIRLVLTEIQRFKKVDHDHPDAVFGQRPDSHAFLCKFWRFGVYFHQTWGFCKAWSALWLSGSIVSNSIIYWLVSSSSRFEIHCSLRY